MSVNRNTLRQQARFGEISPEIYAAELSDRVADWRKLSPSQQLASLDRRLGVGVGAKRQRAKLAALINAPEPATVVAPETKPADKRRKNSKKG